MWDVYPDVVPALEALRARGVALGIVSNFDSRVVRILEGLALAPWFASVTLSSAVGATKPDPRDLRPGPRAPRDRAGARRSTSATRPWRTGTAPGPRASTPS